MVTLPLGRHKTPSGGAAAANFDVSRLVVRSYVNKFI